MADRVELDEALATLERLAEARGFAFEIIDGGTGIKFSVKATGEWLATYAAANFLGVELAEKLKELAQLES